MGFSDEQLVRRTLAGDDAAFDELVARYRRRVYHLALSKVRLRETALDLAQDAFVQAYMGLLTLREPEKFRSWLTSITSNLCLMHLRRESEITMPDDAFDSLESQVGSAESDVDAAVVRSALDDLPNGTRSAALLYFVEEMKLAEVSEFLGISLPAVKSRIRDARMRLRKEMVEMVKHTAKKDEPGDEFNMSLKHKLEIARWYREFADLCANGVPIVSGFDILAKGDFSDPLKAASLRLKEAVLSGTHMSDALKEIPELCTRQTIGMIRAGEVGGMLDWTANFLADWIEIENSQDELELAFWCRTLGSVIIGGAPTGLAFDAILGGVRTKNLRQIVLDAAKAWEDGQPLEPVMARYADVLLPIVQVAIPAGERSGTLGHALVWVADAVNARTVRRLISREIRIPSEKADWMPAFAIAVAEYLHNESAILRTAATTILGRLSVETKAPDVVTALTDADPQVRIAAAQALAEMDYTDAWPELVNRLQDDEPSVRRAAVGALKALNATDAAPAIARLIMDHDQRAANTAMECLASMGATDVLQRQAIDVIGDERPTARVRAAHILKNHPTPDAVDELVKALDDEVLNVSFNAALALAKLGRTEALPVLQKMADTHNEIGYLQRAAAEALDKFGD